MRDFLAMIFVVSAVSVAQARLGETLDQCKTRYGGSTGQLSADQITFRSGLHNRIIVHLRDGRSIQEDLAPESGGVVSQAEMAEFLQANSEGSTWEITGETATSINYFRKDGRATAQKAKPSTVGGGGNVKLNSAGAELIVRYTAAAAAKP